MSYGVLYEVWQSSWLLAITSLVRTINCLLPFWCTMALQRNQEAVAAMSRVQLEIGQSCIGWIHFQNMAEAQRKK